MNCLIKSSTLSIAALALASSANAAEILVTANITTSTTWTADNTYNLQQQIYVMPGATLTIEAGTVVASDTTGNGGGSLAVTKGAQIAVLGTQRDPVIMTSKADTATWTAGNPETGVWRESSAEWGNLTIMGAGYISAAQFTNTPAPNAGNVSIMEGLIGDFVGDPKIQYGGGNDHDDSGTISYLSLRYGGRVIGLGDELNGLSLGAIGDGTDISYVDIMNNVDDGVEIWGGCVNLDHFNIWNIGDDSFDIDQGWRGKAQFGLVVQGYSTDAGQGSGVGDNMVEMDGAENSDYQPVTTSTIYNFTMIGQPLPGAGDGATAWRDNARVQFRNCIIMDCGEKVVRFDDNENGGGYGLNGTLSWAQCWSTAYNAVPAHANDPAAGIQNYCTSPQTDGNLCDIKDTVFFQNFDPAAYTEATARGVFDAGNNNIQEPANSPVVNVGRGPLVVRGGKNMLPVISLDPRPQFAGAAHVGTAPADGFFVPAGYRGAFEPVAQPWIKHWTAADAYGFVEGNDAGQSYCYGDGATATACPCGNDGAVGTGCANSNGYGGKLTTSGTSSIAAGDLVLHATQIQQGPGLYFQGNNAVSLANNGLGVAFGDGLRCAGGNVIRLGVVVAGASETSDSSGINIAAKGGVSAGDTRRYQLWYRNPASSPCGNFFTLTNGIEINWTL